MVEDIDEIVKEIGEILADKKRKCTLFDIAWAVGRSLRTKLITEVCVQYPCFDEPKLMALMEETFDFFKNGNDCYDFAYQMSKCGRKHVKYDNLLEWIIKEEDPKLILKSRLNIPEFRKDVLDLAMAVYADDKDDLEKYIEFVKKDENIDKDQKAEALTRLENTLKKLENLNK